MSQFLDDLENIVLRIDEEEAGPLLRPTTRSPSNTTTSSLPSPFFTERHDDLIRQWLYATQAVGIPQTQAMEELSVIMPRYTLEELTCELRNLRSSDNLRFMSAEADALLRHPFPNLDRDASDLVSVHRHGAAVGFPSGLSLRDFLGDTAGSSVRLLCLEDQDQLRDMLGHPQVALAVAEYMDGVGRDLTRSELPRSVYGWLRSRSTQVERQSTTAAEALRQRSARYTGPVVDKTSWVSEDHDVRFAVCVTVGVWGRKTLWQDVPWKPGGCKDLCLRSLWLLMWLRFLYTPTYGEGSHDRSARQYKALWQIAANKGLEDPRRVLCVVDWHVVDSALPQAKDGKLACTRAQDEVVPTTMSSSDLTTPPERYTRSTMPEPCLNKLVKKERRLITVPTGSGNSDAATRELASTDSPNDLPSGSGQETVIPETPPPNDGASRPFSVRCAFCQADRTWNQVIVYWARLKQQHTAIPLLARLEEIKLSAASFKRHALNYLDDSTRFDTQALDMAGEATSPDFSWMEVDRWNLEAYGVGL